MLPHVAAPRTWLRLVILAALSALGMLFAFVLPSRPADARAGMFTYVGEAVQRGLPLTHALATATCQPTGTVVPSASPFSAHHLFDVSALSESDIWMVGKYIDSQGIHRTLVEHWDGTNWSVIASPSPGSERSSLASVVAISASNVWAVGSQSSPTATTTLIEHWDGTQWSIVPSPNGPAGNGTLTAIAAVAANNVWAVGYYDSGGFAQTLVIHWDGVSWSIVPSPNPSSTNSNFLNGIEALSANDIWAVGHYVSNGGKTLTMRWDGTQWNVVTSPSPAPGGNMLFGVAALSPSDIWAVGSGFNGPTPQTLTMHWDGSTWSAVSSPNPGATENTLESVTALSSNNVWAVGRQSFTGPSAQTLVERWDGTSWSVVASPNPGSPYNRLYGVTRTPGNDIWAVGEYTDQSINRTLVVHYDSPCVTATATPEPLTPTPTITPTPPPCSEAWQVVPSANMGGYSNALSGVAALSSTDVWAVGSFSAGSIAQNLIEHWNGSQWSIVASPNVESNENRLSGVAAVSANDVWAVGYYYNGSLYQTLTLHWDGNLWSVVPSPNIATRHNLLYGITALSPTDVWAVGNSGSQTLIEHWDGNQWSIVPSPNGVIGDVNYLRSISAISPNDMWAVGYYYDPNPGETAWKRLRVHWNGSQWSVVPGPSIYLSDYTFLYGVEAVTANDVWAVGLNNRQTLVEHWNGSSWSIVPSPFILNSRLNGVTATSANDVWAVGYFSNAGIDQTLVMHWDGIQWSVIPSPNSGAGYNRFNAIVSIPANDLWAVGYYLDGSLDQTLVERYNISCATMTPTATSTPTITPTSTSAREMVGHVTWQGPPAQPNVRQQLPITLTLKLGLTEVNYPVQPTDTSGYFTVSVASLAPNTYNWRVKGPKHLANSGTVVLSSDPVTPVEIGLMRAGDANNDNVVSATDFSILRASFGLSTGQTGYDDRADFTGDQVVSASDFNLVRSNFGTGGAPPIGPATR